MKKPAKNNIGFKARKKISVLGKGIMPWLGVLVAVSQTAALGVKHLVLTDADTNNDAAAVATVAQTQADINKFGKDAREYFELKAQKKPTKDVQKQMAALEKTVKALPATISYRIINDKNMSEEDAGRMIDAFSAVASRAPVVIGNGLSYKQNQAIPDVLVTVKKGLPYLDDCRSVSTDADFVVSCAVQKTAQNKDAADITHMGILLGAPLSIFTIGFAGMAMRRRVDEEEEEIKKNEFKSSVDDLRNMLAPKTPPKKDR